jgi:hypothetical protein
MKAPRYSFDLVLVLLLYFDWWLIIAWFFLQLGSLVYKVIGTEVAQLSIVELVFIILYPLVNHFRIFLGKLRVQVLYIYILGTLGGRTRQNPSLLLFFLLSCALCMENVYFLYWQKNM